MLNSETILKADAKYHQELLNLAEMYDKLYIWAEPLLYRDEDKKLALSIKNRFTNLLILKVPIVIAHLKQMQRIDTICNSPLKCPQCQSVLRVNLSEEKNVSKEK